MITSKIPQIRRVRGRLGHSIVPIEGFFSAIKIFVTSCILGLKVLWVAYDFIAPINSVAFEGTVFALKVLIWSSVFIVIRIEPIIEFAVEAELEVFVPEEDTDPFF